MSQKCNGRYDCIGRDDEKGCNVSCLNYKCEKSNMCGNRCDGTVDCTHGEDEISCPNLEHDCATNPFQSEFEKSIVFHSYFLENFFNFTKNSNKFGEF